MFQLIDTRLSRLACAAICCVFAIRHACAFETAPYYPLTGTPTWTVQKDDGTTYTYSLQGTGPVNGVTTTIVTRSDGSKEFVTNDSLGIRVHAAYDPAVNVTGNGTEVVRAIFSPPDTILPANATLGAPVRSSGSMSMIFSSLGTVPFTYSDTNTPAAFESVTVPAGTFEGALRVTRQLTTSGSITYQGKIVAMTVVETSTRWLVGGVGEVEASSTVTRTLTPKGGITQTSVVSHSTVLQSSSRVVRPAPFTIAGKTDAPLDTLVTSDPVTITGVPNGTPVGITGGEYSIESGAFTTAPGIIYSGQRLTVRIRTAATYGTYANASVSVGGVSVPFSTLTKPVNVKRFGFPPILTAAPNALVTAAAVTPGGFEVPVAISVWGGEYSIGGGPFVSTPGMLKPNQSVVLRMRAPATVNARGHSVLTVGNRSFAFVVGTLVPSNDLTALYLYQEDFTTYWNDLIVAGGPVSITPSAQTSFDIVDQTPGSLRSGNVSFQLPPGIAVPGIYSNANGSPPSMDLSLAGISCQAPLQTRFSLLQWNLDQSGNTTRFAANFELRCSNTVVGTLGQIRYHSDVPIDPLTNLPPAAFSFAPVSGAAFYSPVASAPITVSGVLTELGISVTGGAYSIDGGPYTTLPGIVSPSSQVTVQATTTGGSAAQSCATLTIGTLSAPFCATTASYTPPVPFTFDALTGVNFGQTVVSGAVTITSNGVVPITILGGAYSVNGGAYTTAGGSVQNGDRVTVRLNASSASNTQSCATLTVGGVNGDFCATTLRATVPGPGVVVPLLLSD